MMVTIDSESHRKFKGIPEKVRSVVLANNFGRLYEASHLDSTLLTRGYLHLFRNFNLVPGSNV